jgi:hypothetical protein
MLGKALYLNTVVGLLMWPTVCYIPFHYVHPVAH